MANDKSRPLIGVSTSLGHHPERTIPHHSAGEKYLQAVACGAGGTPLLIPGLPDCIDVDHMASLLDGLFLTGGRANVEPHHYAGPAFPEDEIIDPGRDNVVLPLIRSCVRQGVPVFGVCRGLQEINVALGGSLHYRVHLVPGKLDHRMPQEGDIEYKFGLRHAVTLAPDGMLADMLGAADCRVNSAHGQGIDRLGDGLVVEALAPDGLVEAIRLEDAKAFTVGVQWHAEWRFDEHPLSKALFEEFGRAAGARRAARARQAAEA
ncbi:MAG: gamma-glutamyl-gamma-aminobutyrate hydrolase family protein [Rhodospirillales bacterium]